MLTCLTDNRKERFADLFFGRNEFGKSAFVSADESGTHLEKIKAKKSTIRTNKFQMP
jgi:hypothetical protein